MTQPQSLQPEEPAEPSQSEPNGTLDRPERAWRRADTERRPERRRTERRTGPEARRPRLEAVEALLARLEALEALLARLEALLELVAVAARRDDGAAGGGRRQQVLGRQLVVAVAVAVVVVVVVSSELREALDAAGGVVQHRLTARLGRQLLAVGHLHALTRRLLDWRDGVSEMMSNVQMSKYEQK